ncbi:MAG: PorP/SprF family type IX secretion system membrane protein [Lewinellaceae bacterium]|nr:PorP/SprF family type IX secretion system membrane protein [Saprospiraceae bacterium]MCB9343384.1 PorP/SprF family type IX secretion system membrane protein [Lewinellaceae bacterium]
MYNLPVLCAIVLVPLSQLGAQSPSFSQFYTHRPSLNPAYVSAGSGLELSAGYRRQWGQIQHGLNTGFAAASLRTCALPLGFGVYVSDVHETYFNYRIQEAGLQFGGFFGSSKHWSVHGALQAGMGQQRVDYDRLLFTGDLDPVFGIQGTAQPYYEQDGSRLGSFDLGAGAVFRSSARIGRREYPYSLGAVLHHVGGSGNVSFEQGDYRRPMRITLHGAATAPVSGQYLSKSVLYLHFLGRFEWESVLQRSTVGVIAQYDAAHLGLLYQYNQGPFNFNNTHALTICLGADFKLGDADCTIQYGFDGALSGLDQTASGGAHELTLNFRFDKTCVFQSRSSKNKGRTSCYRFAGKGYRGFY